MTSEFFVVQRQNNYRFEESRFTASLFTTLGKQLLNKKKQFLFKYISNNNFIIQSPV